MNDEAIAAALSDIGGENDPTLKNLKLASLVSAVFRERGVELVVVGGSAIEFYTDGAYVSGDIDLCVLTPAVLDLRTRQEVMGRLGAEGGPRNWRVAGAYVDVFGWLETYAERPRRELQGPWGVIRLVPPEELLVERVLVSVYPHIHAPSERVARKLIGVALGGTLEFDWQEVARLAKRPEFKVWPECRTLVNKVADELGKPRPYHSHE